MTTLLTLHDPATAQRYYAAGSWRQETFHSLLREHAARRPDAFALRDARRRLTWAELRAWVDAVAADLEAAGLRRGDRVGVWLPNRAEGVVVFLACARNGYVCNPSLHRTYTVAEIAALMTRIEAAALFAQSGHGADGHRADIFAAARSVPSLRRIYRVPPPDEETPHAAAGEHPFPDSTAPPSAAPADANPDKVVYLAFTSGTTGTPKGVMHSDNTLLANARSMVEDWGHGAGSVVLSVSPMSHHIGTVALAQSLAAGMELVVNDPPPGMTIVDWIAATGATYVMGVPTHAMDILAEMGRRGLDRLGKVAVFYMAGSPIPREVAQAFLDRGITPQNVYGMTENSSHQYTLPDDDARTIVATCGRACRAYEISLWREDDPEVLAPPGAIGEIGGRGACLMLGYFADQAATERAFNRQGWFMSGDLGRLDAQGCLEILGRKKDLIIRGGRNIYPARLEDLALAHPDVAKVAAFAVPDRRLGERVCLAVIPCEGRLVDPADLLRHLDAAGLSKYDMPEYFVALDEFPLTASGKILKRELADWARSGRIAPVAVRWADPDQGRI